VAEGIDVVFSGAGLPLSLPECAVSGHRTELAPIVSSGRAAEIICRRWSVRYGRLPDAIVVEGPLAGGHLGFKPGQIHDPQYSLENLLSEVLAAVAPFEQACGRTIPVIAAGGIYTGADIHRFLQLGAAGVQMGTRFVTTHECDVAPQFKAAYLTCAEGDTVIINSPVGLPGRAIRNGFLDDISHGKRRLFKCPYRCLRTCDVKNSPYCIADALVSAYYGNLGRGFAFAGANAWRTTAIISVKELFRAILGEYRDAVAGRDPADQAKKYPRTQSQSVSGKACTPEVRATS
jgi:nitronate monooxygenase